MTLAIVYSRAVNGMQAPLVTVEVHLSNGMAGFHIVGLPEAAVKESRDRVRSALLNTKFEFPIKHITVNLAPADLPKEGGRFDLAIAIGVLAASRQIPWHQLAEYEWLGELALSGELRSVRGVLPSALAAKVANRTMIIPKQNADEAGILHSNQVLVADHLLSVCAHLRNETLLQVVSDNEMRVNEMTFPDLKEVKGQPHAKRALAIAAAGKHSMLMIGSPGVGKTMLASRLPGILPSLSEADAMEVATIASISTQGFQPNQWRQIPFRSPHHSASSVAISGGGRPPKPGEVSLAHGGILFLDELPEFKRAVLECLREPLESGEITISRAAIQLIFPARFQLIAAMNPCPCGYAGSTVRECSCSAEQVKKYRTRLSGPLLDRLDMQIEVAALQSEQLVVSTHDEAETSAYIKQRVMVARERQLLRQGKLNTVLSVSELDRMQADSVKKWLSKQMDRFHFSARVYHRLLKLARTIADYEGADWIDISHISEAWSYRAFDRTASGGR